MTLFEELLPASYKGATFLIASASTDGGRKDQRHEFPNSDRQTIEDLGLLPRSYSIIGLITGPNYIFKRDTLLAALEDGETGVLSHPFYGELQQMKARSFSISESIADLGRAEISMTFEVSNDLGVPIQTENTLSLINFSNDSVISAANIEIVDNWEVDTKFSGNFAAAQSKLAALNAAFSNNSGVIVKAAEKINSFNAQINDFGNEINNLILQPQELADSIINLGQGMNGLYSTAEQQFTAWKEFFDFGDKDTTTMNKTAGLIQRDKNNNTINQSMQSQALSYAYLAASQIDYNTINDLDDIAERLEEQYQKVIINNSIGQTLRDAVTNMRENTNSFFNQQRVNLNRIININTAELPARVISYQYYADSSIGEEIANLNNNANVSFLEGQIQVVTQ